MTCVGMPPPLNSYRALQLRSSVRRSCNMRTYQPPKRTLGRSPTWRLCGGLKACAVKKWRGDPNSRITPFTDVCWSQVDLDLGIVRLEVGESKNDDGRTVYLDEELKAVFNLQCESENGRGSCVLMSSPAGKEQAGWWISNRHGMQPVQRPASACVFSTPRLPADSSSEHDPIKESTQ
jgi:hypothetical protein